MSLTVVLSTGGALSLESAGPARDAAAIVAGPLSLASPQPNNEFLSPFLAYPFHGKR